MKTPTKTAKISGHLNKFTDAEMNFLAEELFSRAFFASEPEKYVDADDKMKVGIDCSDLFGGNESHIYAFESSLTKMNRYAKGRFAKSPREFPEMLLKFVLQVFVMAINSGKGEPGPGTDKVALWAVKIPSLLGMRD